MNFKEYIGLLESKKIKIYHGGKKITKLEPKWMFHDNGNFQEGVGIYFGTLETAEQYIDTNKNDSIIEAEIVQKNFINSRGYISDFLSDKTMLKIVKDIFKANKEEFYYFLSDWVYVEEPIYIEDSHLMELVQMMKDEQVRNWQIQLSEIDKFAFIDTWNKNTKIDGTYNSDLEFWCIINPRIKIKQFEK